MKNLLIKILSLIPLRLKIIFFKAWIRSSQDFWLYARNISHSPMDLTRNRLSWNKLDFTINRIHNRFGDVDIYLCTDRVDLPVKKNLITSFAGNPDGLLSLDADPLTVICAYESDQRLVDVLKMLNKKKNIYYYCLTQGLPVARYFHRSDLAKKVLFEEFNRRRGKFDLSDFEHIIQAIDITSAIEGAYIEIGVYRGDSAILALEYMKQSYTRRESWFLDRYDGFTGPESMISNDAFWLNSHADNSIDYVTTLLSSYNNAHVIKADIILDELPAEIHKIAVCNIDVDIYEATLAAFQKVAPRIAKNGIIICEDAGHTPFLGGAYLAVREFLDSPEGHNFIPLNLLSGQMFFIRK